MCSCCSLLLVLVVASQGGFCVLAVAASTQWQELHKSQPFYLLMGLLLSWLFGAVGWIGMVDCCNLASANTTFSCCRHGHQGSTMLRLAIISCCMHAQHAACICICVQQRTLARSTVVTCHGRLLQSTPLPPVTTVLSAGASWFRSEITTALTCV